MNSIGMIAVRLGKTGKKEWQAEQIYGGLFSPGPDPAELRVWVADETELGKRGSGRLRQHRPLPAWNAGPALLRGPAAQVP